MFVSCIYHEYIMYIMYISGIYHVYIMYISCKYHVYIMYLPFLYHVYCIYIYIHISYRYHVYIMYMNVNDIIWHYMRLYDYGIYLYIIFYRCKTHTEINYIAVPQTTRGSSRAGVLHPRSCCALKSLWIPFSEVFVAPRWCATWVEYL